MDAAEDISEEIELSGALDFVAGAPLIDESVSDLLDSHFEDAARAKVCITSNGGAKRETVKPTVVKFGDATLTDVGDALQCIAWSHCSRAGVKGRYCVEVFTRDIKGRIVKAPHRAYFDLSPDGDAPEIEGDTDRPSQSYVQALERTNERTLRILQDSARAVIRRDEQYHRDRVTTKVAEGVTQVELERVKVEKIAVESAGKRKDTIFNAAASMLPKAVTAALTHLAAAPENETDKTLAPGDRIKAFLDDAELKIFIDGVGAERWAKLEASTTISECREVLATFGPDDAAAMVSKGLSAQKLTEIASWEDVPEKTVAEPKDEEAAQ